MTAHAVVEVVDLLDAAGVACWVDGGWGVDALLGRQTRAHADLDLVVDVAQLERVRHALGGAGFTVLRDWLPTAIASAHSDGREVDLHPVTRTSGGGGSQELSPAPPFHYGPPASGVVDRRRVARVDETPSCGRTSAIRRRPRTVLTCERSPNTSASTRRLPTAEAPRGLGLDAGHLDEAVGEVVVDQPHGLHQGVGRRRADEADPALLELLGHGHRLRCRTWHLSQA